ncbi:MAG TPA: hypothetical protein VGZ93_13030 [Candidatus Methylacidiphilales bacterium]|jgi:hypothetical protein|nr:hypothetical protein [Candidatus Methylacidiphilales bacterium]
MARLPDRFDLWVRKARKCRDTARQADYVLGALAGLNEWHFLNAGTKEAPQAATAQIESEPCRLVFSDAARIGELFEEQAQKKAPLPVITIPAAAAMAWCVEGRTGLLVNPGEDAVMIPFGRLEAFHAEWNRRGGRQAAGFWIPNMTTEEEDFWRENEL